MKMPVFAKKPNNDGFIHIVRAYGGEGHGEGFGEDNDE
jgi:hypothetical protein